MSFLPHLFFFFLTLIAVAPLVAKSDSGPDQLDGHFSENLYSSPSYSIICSFKKDIVGAPTFFIMDDSDGNFESVTFGHELSKKLLIWNLRKQKLDGNDLTQKNYISEYYKESPYSITEEVHGTKSVSGIEGKTGVLGIKLGEDKQRHGYWVGSENGWLLSVQTLPPLSEGDKTVLSREMIESKTLYALEVCSFN